MIIHELPVRAFLEHLRRHPFPEIIDGECLSGLQSVEKQYGDTISHGAGLEVRLGSPARYADYILNIDTSGIPGVSSLWYEIDCEEFTRANRQGDRIVPCLFANVQPDPAGGYTRLWEETLPPFAGEERAARLRPALDRVTALLPERAQIKQIGTMSGRGELDILRLVILFHSRPEICDFLTAAGWQGDAAALGEAMAPWQYSDWIAVNIDLGADGVLPKIGRVMTREDTDYVLVEAQIRKKDKQKFLDAMEDLKTKMLICGHRDYADRAGELIRELEMNLVEEYMQDEKLMKKLGLADKNIIIVDG